MLYYLIVTLYVLVCGLLIITILLQQGKGGDIASAFGGGSSQAVFGARAGATLLTRATSVLAALFVIGALTLTVWGTRGPSSVVGGIEGPGAGAGAAGERNPGARGTGNAAAGQHDAVGSDLDPDFSSSSPSRKWRNWQTHQLEGLALARAWRFESPLPHHSTRLRPAFGEPQARSWRAIPTSVEWS